MTITIKDIARFAGVSIATVSKVINHKGNVSPELKMRVEAVVEKLNFRPSALARSVKNQRTQTIGLIVPQIVNSFYIQVVDIIEREINRRGYLLFLGKSHENIEKDVHYLRKFLDMRINGLMLASSSVLEEDRLKEELKAYQQLEIPILLLVRSMTEHLFDTVLLDNFMGSYKATHYLLKNGHERIGIISSSSRTSTSQERIAGYERALQEFGMTPEPSLVHIGGWSLNSGYEITNKIMSSYSPPSAIFMASNVQMLGALRALKEMKVKIPDKISVIGFDDTERSALVDPSITVVRPLTEVLCESAINILIDRITGAYTGQPRLVKVPTELVIRGSVKKL